MLSFAPPSTSSLFSFLLLVHSFPEGKSDKEILDQLLTNSRYDKRLLPPVEGKVFEYHLNGEREAPLPPIVMRRTRRSLLLSSRRRNFSLTARLKHFFSLSRSNSIFAGTLTVNVSVLLLSLASPDESSLVSCSAQAGTLLVSHSGSLTLSSAFSRSFRS
jgi:hypothetical protein